MHRILKHDNIGKCLYQMLKGGQLTFLINWQILEQFSKLGLIYFL
jgi:hypothetical protein